MTGINGSLATMSVQDMLQWLNIGKKTGTLVLKRRKERVLVYFKEGIIIAASSSQPNDNLGQFLKREGFITDRQIDKVRLIQQHTKELFGFIVLELGILSEKHLLEGVKKQTEEIIFGVFHWNEGTFSFIENELPSNTFIPVTLLAHNLIMEGAKRQDEWKGIKNIFPSRNIVVGLTETGKNHLMDLELPGLDAEVMSKINGRRSIEEIIARCGASDYAVFKALEKSYKLGEIEKLGTKEPATEPDLVQDLLKEAAILKSGGYLEEAVTRLKKAYAENPENPEVKDMLSAVQTEYQEVMNKTVGNLDRIPVLLCAIDSPRIRNLNLSAEEGFLLSRIDNLSTIKQIMSICGLKKDQVIQGFYGFLKKEIVGFQDQIRESRAEERTAPRKMSEKLMYQLEDEFAREGIKKVITPQDQIRIINFYNKIKNADYFSVLYVNSSSSKQEIINSYKKLVKEYYPAQFLEISPFFTMKLKAIIRLLSLAVDTLTSKTKRPEYIESLKS